MRLYIDDERFPQTNHNWNIVRNYDEAIEFMNERGCPDYVTFDHDLGDQKTGYDIAKWMVEKDLDSHGKFIPENFTFNVHSANPAGRANIVSLLSNYVIVFKGVVDTL